MKDILLVDDNPEFLLSLADGLRSVCGRQCKVFIAQNGKEALEMLKTIIFDVVITDLYMPEINGYELIEYVNDHYGLNISVIIMTDHVEGVFESIARNRCVKYVLQKRVEFNDIASKVLSA